VAVIDGDLARLASRNPWSDRAAESMANALLMAAARDMYDVLKEFVGALGCESEDDYPCGRCLGCRGEAALASAEGYIRVRGGAETLRAGDTVDVVLL